MPQIVRSFFQSRESLYKLFLLLSGLEALLALVVYFMAPSMERNVWILGLSRSRILLGGAFLGVLCAWTWLTLKSLRNEAWLSARLDHWHAWLEKEHNRAFAGSVLLLIVLSLVLVVFVFPRNTAFFSNFLSESFDQLLSTLAAVVQRLEPFLLWGLAVFLQFFILLIVFSSRRATVGGALFHLPTLAKLLWLYLSLPLTVFHWAILYYQLYVFVALPHWFWKFYIKPSQNDAWFGVLFVVCLWLSYWVLKRPHAVVRNLVVVMLIAYLLQLGFGFIEGQGFESLRINFMQKGHHGYPQYACKQPELLHVITHYEEVAATDPFFMTKPPGVISFYVVVQRITDWFYPATDFDGRYTHLTQVMSVAFPLLAALLPLLLYFFSKPYLGAQQAVLPGLLYVFIPAFILTPLYLDQEFYPLLFVGVLWLVQRALMRRSSAWALTAGIAAFLAMFFSFSMLPLYFLAAVWIGIDYLQHRQEISLWQPLKLGMSLALGGVVSYAAFRWLLNYDVLLRYTHALAQHRLHKDYETGFQQVVDAAVLNNTEFMAWMGIPLFLLFLFAVLHMLGRFLKDRGAAHGALLLAFILTYLLLNAMGQTRSEVARLWIFMLPLVALFSTLELRSLFKRRTPVFLWTIALQLITTFLTFKYQDLD